MSPDFDLLSNAVERLERQNANFKKIGLTAVVLITAALLLGQSQATRTVEAERFVLKGADGSVRAKLQATDGSTQFVFYNTAGKVRVAIKVTPEDEGLEMRDDSGRLLALVSAPTRQTLLSTPTSATIAVLGNAGGPGVILNATPDVASARVGDAGGHRLERPRPRLVGKPVPNSKIYPESVQFRLIRPDGRPSVKIETSEQGSGLTLGGGSISPTSY